MMASSPDPTFDPSAHAVTPQRWFEDFVVGERYVLPSRTITEANFAAFQAVSGDNHPIHYDVEFWRMACRCCASPRPAPGASRTRYPTR
jgi:acyl dehydratase